MTTLVKSGQGETPLANYQAPSVMEGAGGEDLILGRIHIFQGLPEERKLFGSFEPGDWVNTLTKEKIEPAKFVAIAGYEEFFRFSDIRGQGLVYRSRNKADVPQGDLEWDRSVTPSRPPKASRFINWIILLEGWDFPLILTFKSTSIRMGQTLYTLERMRGNRGPGLYAMTTREKTGPKGTWLTPEIRPVGTPSIEMLRSRAGILASIGTATVKTADDDMETEIGSDGETGPF